MDIGNGCVFCFIMVNCVDGSFFDIVWCVEIGFVCVEVDDVYVFGFEFVGFLGYCDGGGGFYLGKCVGDKSYDF